VPVVRVGQGPGGDSVSGVSDVFPDSLSHFEIPYTFCLDPKHLVAHCAKTVCQPVLKAEYTAVAVNIEVA
jgi:hypothetical protein